MPELTPRRPDARAYIPTSVVLQQLHDEAPTDHFTLGWLMGSLRKRSFGIIMLLLALVARAADFEFRNHSPTALTLFIRTFGRTSR